MLSFPFQGSTFTFHHLQISPCCFGLRPAWRRKKLTSVFRFTIWNRNMFLFRLSSRDPHFSVSSSKLQIYPVKIVPANYFRPPVTDSGKNRMQTFCLLGLELFSSLQHHAFCFCDERLFKTSHLYAMIKYCVCTFRIIHWWITHPKRNSQRKLLHNCHLWVTTQTHLFAVMVLHFP